MPYFFLVDATSILFFRVRIHPYTHVEYGQIETLEKKTEVPGL